MSIKLSYFIAQNMADILEDWDAFAETLTPAADTMNKVALRDHAKQILEAIARDLDSEQTDQQQADKSKGLAPDTGATAAATHGALRQRVGFDLNQLCAEYRAMRASVLKLWHPKVTDVALAEVFRDAGRFNEAVDQALAESVARYMDEVNTSRETFLAVLGHDLRNPLNSISMSAHYLGRPGVETAPAHLKHVTRIAKGVATMDAMIRDLIEFTRTRMGKGLPIVPRPCDFAEVCKGAVEETSTAYPSDRISFRASGDCNGRFDAPRLHQVFTNLLVNAIQHGARLPVSLEVSGDRESVTAKVRNSGIVIPVELRQVIFNPLVQLPRDDSAPAENPTSLGLGLFIAREIVLGHHGTIGVESSEDDGTVFTVALPKQPVASAQ